MPRARWPVVVSLLIVASAPLATAAGCKATVQGRYETPVQRDGKVLRLKVIYDTSSARRRMWFWSDLNLAAAEQPLGYEAGKWFSQTLNLPGRCAKNRRYRFRIVGYDPDSRLEVASVWKYVPDETGWTKDQTIDLGDIGKLFP